MEVLRVITLIGVYCDRPSPMEKKSNYPLSPIKDIAWLLLRLWRQRFTRSVSHAGGHSVKSTLKRTRRVPVKVSQMFAIFVFFLFIFFVCQKIYGDFPYEVLCNRYRDNVTRNNHIEGNGLWTTPNERENIWRRPRILLGQTWTELDTKRNRNK